MQSMTEITGDGSPVPYVASLSCPALGADGAAGVRGPSGGCPGSLHDLCMTYRSVYDYDVNRCTLVMTSDLRYVHSGRIGQPRINVMKPNGA